MTDYTSILPEGRQLQIDLSNPEEQMVLRIVEGGIVTVGFYYGTTVREHYNLDLVYDIAHRANADDLRAELAEGGEISALIDRVIAGHDSRWNGQRYQGTFSEDAQEAHDELRILRINTEECILILSLLRWLAGLAGTHKLILAGGGGGGRGAFSYP